MRILTLSDVYFPRVNGVSTSIQIQRRALEARGHEMVVVAPAYPHAELGGGVERVPSRRVPFDPEDRAMKIAPLRHILAALEPHRFDLVHAQTPFIARREGVRLGRAFDLPVVETHHTFFEGYLHHYLPFMPGNLLRRLTRFLTRRQANQVDHIVVPSTAMRDVLEAYRVKNPVSVIPTGLDLAELEAGDGDRFRRKHGIPRGRPTLVHIGRLAHEKNIPFLLHVLAKVRRDLPTTLLVLAGEGPAVEDLRRLASHLGLARNVLFVGYLSRDSELQDCYRAGDLFVFASRTETQGLVLLEAMALGVPVVSTAALGTRDIVAPERGAVESPEEVGEFAAKVVALLMDPERRERMASEARRFVRRWSADEMADRLVDLYASLLPAARAA